MNHISRYPLAGDFDLAEEAMHEAFAAAPGINLKGIK
jgi:predicted RNA polymerase sigma factor